MISVVINTLNEEKNIAKAIASVEKINNEVIVCDMHSDDRTVSVAEQLGAKVYEHKKVGYVEPARNFAVEKAKGDWVLILDADEEIPPILADRLKTISIDKQSADYYRLPRKNIIFGKWIKHSRWWPDYNIRFFKKGYVSWNEIIHSVPMTVGKGLDLESVEENAIVHNHYQSVEQYIDRLNRYTTYQKTALQKKGYKFKWQDLIKEPVQEFVGRYFQGEGYKDGLHGLALSLLQSFSEMVLYLKIWQDEGFEPKLLDIKNTIDEIKKSQKEINYWTADTLVKEGGSWVQRVKRKLKLP